MQSRSTGSAKTKHTLRSKTCSVAKKHLLSVLQTVLGREKNLPESMYSRSQVENRVSYIHHTSTSRSWKSRARFTLRISKLGPPPFIQKDMIIPLRGYALNMSRVKRTCSIFWHCLHKNADVRNAENATFSVIFWDLCPETLLRSWPFFLCECLLGLQRSFRWFRPSLAEFSIFNVPWLCNCFIGLVRCHWSHVLYGIVFCDGDTFLDWGAVLHFLFFQFLEWVHGCRWSGQIGSGIRSCYILL